MKLSRILPLCFVAAAVVASCDNASEIGNSLVSDSVEIVEDSTLTLTGKSVDNPSIMARTLTQLLGIIDAEEYGSLRSDFVTQFMPTATLDTTGVTAADIDSVKLYLWLPTGGFVGDSIVPMGVRAYRLNKQLPSPIYSTFDPDEYFSTSDLMGSTVYTANALYSDSANVLGHRTIEIDLPRQFGVDLFNEYKTNPSTFSTPEAFAKWFPGLYVTTSFGSGRVVQINEARVNFHYRRHETVTTDSTSRDTVYNNVSSYLGVTPEVITNNNLRYRMASQLQSRIDAGEAILTAPTGKDVEFIFPAQEMLKRYHEQGGAMSVFNTLQIEFPVEEIENACGIEPPQCLLMVLKSKRDEFFAKNQLTDNTTSFYAYYNSIDKSYTFTGMRAYFIDLLDKEEISADDYTFVLTPIEVTTTQVSQYYEPTVTAISPYVLGPAMCKFNFDKAKIKFTYARQNLNF